MGIIYASIASGQSVSGNIDCTNAGAIQGIWVPTITSADLLVQSNVDTTSGNFVRVRALPPNSGDLRYATGPGSCYLNTGQNLPWMAYMRLEAGAVQTVVNTFALLTVR